MFSLLHMSFFAFVYTPTLPKSFCLLQSYTFCLPTFGHSTLHRPIKNFNCSSRNVRSRLFPSTCLVGFAFDPIWKMVKACFSPGPLFNPGLKKFEAKSSVNKFIFLSGFFPFKRSSLKPLECFSSDSIHNLRPPYH